MDKKYAEGLIRAYELRSQKYPPDIHIDYLESIKSALELYKVIIRENGENPYILNAIATCYSEWATSSPVDFSKWDDAISTILCAIQLAPDNGYFHAVLASYYHFGKLEYEKAVIEYRKAIELNPSDIWALNNLAGLYGHPENVITIQEAINWRESVVSLEPNKPLNHALLAELYFENRQFRKAQEEAIKSLLYPRPLETGWLEKMKDILNRVGDKTER